MLHFFRKHQKIFFLFTTIIIVLSFVFFGTYQALAPSFGGEKAEEEESYVGQMVRFLNTEHWMASRGFFETNFLNDGVISKEFLESGMADLVIKNQPDLCEDYPHMVEKEKNFTPYVHPYLPSLSAMNIWSMFAPELPAKLKAHQEGKGSFKRRRELFLAQKDFPPAFLAQVIRYQEQSHSNFPQDSRLNQGALDLFGYHTLSDWFGERAMIALANTIIHTADTARKLGYKVSKEEILADLILKSQETYNMLKERVQLPVENGYGLLQLYLQQTGMREKTALKIWEDVTLFRRLMHSVGNAALTDPFPLSEFYAFAYENATIELYQMPQELRLQSTEDLKRLEVYLAAVAGEKDSPLDIPLEYDSLESIQMRAPELVGRRYDLYFAHISKKGLQARVGIKETLDWECDPENWKKLLRQFPELAQKVGTPFEILEGMDPKGRRLVDSYARKQVVAAHPEWIKEALTEAELAEKSLFLSKKSEKPLEGIYDTDSLIAALDSRDEIFEFTQDGENYYRFLLKERSKVQEVLTFKEAVKAKVLDKLFDSLQADALVKGVTEACPKEYQSIPFAYRFAPFMVKCRYKQPEGSLVRQFSVEKKEKTITRAEKFFVALNEVLTLEPGSFSIVKADAKEGAYLYRFIEKKTEHTLPLEKMVKSQAILSKEARCHYFEKLLPTCLKK